MCLWTCVPDVVGTRITFWTCPPYKNVTQVTITKLGKSPGFNRNTKATKSFFLSFFWKNINLMFSLHEKLWRCVRLEV